VLRSCTGALFAASKRRSRVETDSGLDQRSTLLLAAAGVAGERDAAVAVQFCVLPHAGEHAERCGMLSPRRRKLRLRIGDNISPRTRVARDGIAEPRAERGGGASERRGALRVTYDTRGEGGGTELASNLAF